MRNPVNSHSMKMKNALGGSVVQCLAILLLGGANLLAVPKEVYFDQNQATAGFGITAGSTYIWDTALETWNTSTTGAGIAAGSPGSTFSAWSDGDTAHLSTATAAGSYNIQLNSNITLGGLYFDRGSATGSITISATSARTLTFATGAQIKASVGSGRNIIFGDNLNLSGDFEITSTNGFVVMVGSGAAYNGKITVNSPLVSGTNSLNAGLQIDTNTKTGTNTRIELNTGTLHVTGGGEPVIGELSGSGGLILRPSSGAASTLNVDQSTSTQWGGNLGYSGGGTRIGYSFKKSGIGTLILSSEDAHHLTGSITAHEGSLYVIGDIASTSGTLSIDSAGNFGGTTTTSKRVVMNAATSTLSPGAFNLDNNSQEVGTLTLANGLTASSGGTFRFAMNGIDGDDNLINSQIVLSGGTLVLGGVLTADFLDLGLGDIQAGVAYTIFSAAGISTTGWAVGDLPVGWAVGANPFSVDGNNLQVTFASIIPEPSSIILFGLAGALLADRANRRAKRA